MHNDAPNFAGQAHRGGEQAADRALFIVRALQWLQTNVHVDNSREDIDDFSTLIEIGLDALEKELETTRHALSACRIEAITSAEVSHG